MHSERNTVLFVANYPSNTGFAWSHIEGLFASVADVLERERELRTWVAYPELDGPPATLANSAARAVALDASLETWESLRSTVGFIRRERVAVVYLTDRPAWSWKYAVLRLAGVRQLLLHDRKSGAGVPPTGIKRLAKTALARLRPITPDRYIAVSDFVKKRLIDVARVPARRVVRVYNGFAVEPDGAADRCESTVHELFDLERDARVVACACRAAKEKGVDVLLRAFDRAVSSGSFDTPPYLIFLGEGPALADLRRLREALATRDRIILGGYVPDAVTALRTAEAFVVPSLWEDAFPSAVLEPMSRGRPVIASAVGGIPEMIEDGVSGVLVPPGDEARLAEAIGEVLSNPERAATLGRSARTRVAERFKLEDQIRTIAGLVSGEPRG